MKKLLLPLFLVSTIITVVNAQSPPQMNYQAVVRDASGQPIASGSLVTVWFRIHDGTPTGSDIYDETRTAVTNQFGLITVAIGDSANLAGVPWGSGPKFLQVQIDATGGTNFIDMGTSQLLSVPYAMFAGNGTVGATGPTGAAGSNGANGSLGVTGPQGNVGANGVTGPLGPTGPQGNVGSQGPAGPSGQQGFQGAQGLVGVQGPQGIQGPQGVAGPAGAQGAAGVAGPPGAQGNIGPVGPQGLIGATGAQGPQGNIGATGPQGSVGPTGANGAPGAVGATGSNGITGATGPSGGPVGPTGLQGDIGTTGPAGPTGADGAQGPIGTPGTDGAVGATGPSGQNGTDGVVGPTGPSGQDGAQGPTGPSGQDGTDGAVGPTGPSGQDGVDGAVGATGPSGQDGAQGPIGPSGQDGIDGAVGPTGPIGPTGDIGPTGSGGGATGPTGPSGQDGIDGTVGATGPSGQDGIDGAVGATGPSGQDGAIGATGATGPSGQDGVDGAVGATGPSGQDGAIGVTGPSGQDGVDGATGATGDSQWTLIGNDITNNNTGKVQMGDVAGNTTGTQLIVDPPNSLINMGDVNNISNGTSLKVDDANENIVLNGLSTIVNSNTTLNGTLQINSGTLASGNVLTSDGSGNATWQPAAGGAGLWVQSGNNIYNSNTGNVGVGTTTPNDALQVANGLLRFNDYGVRNNLTIPNSCGGGIWTIPGIQNWHSGLYAMDYSGGCGDEWFIAEGDRDGAEASTLVISQQNDNNDNIALMPSGSVGIGTVAPVQLLEVNGTAAIDGSLAVGTQTPNATLDVEGTVKFNDGTTQSLGWVLTTDGNGNGTWQAPSASLPAGNSGDLQYNGGSALAATDFMNYNSGQLNLDLQDSYGGLHVMGVSGGEASIALQPDNVGNGSAGQWILYTNGNQLNNPNDFGILNSGQGGTPMVIQQATNNVGIGTNNPQARLEVNGVSIFDFNVGIGIANPGASLTVRSGSTDPSAYTSGKTVFVTGPYNSGQGYDGGVEFRHDNLSQGIGFGFNTIYATGFNTDQDLNLIARGGGNLTLQAYGGATGYVGIGTNSPAQLLEVNGSVAIDSSLGIGTQTPNAKLDVEGTVKFYDGTPQSAGWVLTTDGNGNGTWQAPASGGGGSGPWTTSGNNIYNSNSANVGIGETNPVEKLSINGNIVFSRGSDVSIYAQQATGGNTGGAISIAAGIGSQAASGTNGGALNLSGGNCFGSNTPGSVNISGGYNQFVSSAQEGAINFITNNSTKVSIDGDGNIKVKDGTVAPIQFIQLAGLLDDAEITNFLSNTYSVDEWNAAVVGFSTGGSCGSAWSGTPDGFQFYWTNNSGIWQLTLDMHGVDDGCNSVQVMFTRKEISSRSGYTF